MKNDITYPRPLLAGQHNFRDLGGIPVAGGRKLKSGLLFRSGDLHSITALDVEFLEAINLSMIIDFRSQREREVRPNREIKTVKEVCHLEIHDEPREKAARFVEMNNKEGLDQLLVEEYPRIIQHYRDQYRQFFTEIQTTLNIPLVFQCSAGKDRTGLAAVFLLTSLGASREDILADYYATNYYAQAHAYEIIGLINNNGHNGELMRPLLEVRPEYLAAGLKEIDLQSGSLQNFVLNELKADAGLLQAKFLES